VLLPVAEFTRARQRKAKGQPKKAGHGPGKAERAEAVASVVVRSE